MKLNGWQRIGVIVTAIYTISIIVAISVHTIDLNNKINKLENKPLWETLSSQDAVEFYCKDTNNNNLDRIFCDDAKKQLRENPITQEDAEKDTKYKRELRQNKIKILKNELRKEQIISGSLILFGVPAIWLIVYFVIAAIKWIYKGFKQGA